MAQGKLKVKSKVPGGKAKKRGAGGNKANPKKHSHGVSKPSTKPRRQAAAKLQKTIQKKINANIESELTQRAAQVEEGKPFLCIEGAGPKRRGNKK